MVFMNDFLTIYRVQYEYIDIFVCGNDGVSAYKFRILYSMITMKELAK